jgi:hypothetical protein
MYIGENLKKEYWLRNEAGSHSLMTNLLEICLLLSILLITLFFLSVSLPGLASLLLFSPGSSLIFSIVLSTSASRNLYHLFTNFSMVCLKALFLVFFSSSYTPLLLALPFQTHLQIINFMRMTLNSTFYSPQLVFLTTSRFLKQLFQTFPTGCLQIFSHSILPKLNFSSLVFRSNSLSSSLLQFIFQIMSLSHLLILLVTCHP